jgi:hypothetical protein
LISAGHHEVRATALCKIIVKPHDDSVFPEQLPDYFKMTTKSP